MSQPSLSVQIAALEDELGAPLFDRLGRQAVLTEAGTLFRVHAERVLREAEQAVQTIKELAGAEHGRLLVGSLSTVNSYLIPPVVCRFKRQFPNIHLHVQALPSSTIEQDLLESRIDLGLCLLPVTHGKLVTTRLFDETLALVASPRFRLPGRRMRMKDLADLPLVLLPSDYCLRKMIEVECAQAGVQPRVSVEMTSPEGILEAVKHGIGLTILPELYVRRRLPGTTLRLVHLYDPVPRHTVGLAHVANRHMGKAAQEFMQLCQLTLKDLRLRTEGMIVNAERT